MERSACRPRTVRPSGSTAVTTPIRMSFVRRRSARMTSFTSSAWKAGATLLKLAPDGGKCKAEVVYDKKEIGNAHGGLVRVDKSVFGGHNLGPWECQDFETGAIRWKSDALGSGSLIYADGCLYCLARRAKSRCWRRRRDDYRRASGPVHAAETLGESEAERQGLDASGRQRRAAVRARSGVAFLLQGQGAVTRTAEAVGAMLSRPIPDVETIPNSRACLTVTRST